MEFDYDPTKLMKEMNGTLIDIKVELRDLNITLDGIEKALTQLCKATWSLGGE